MNLTTKRTHFPKLFVLLALLAGLGGAARAQQVVTTPTGSKLEVRVIPEKKKILPGEPIEVAVEYRFLKPEGGTPDKHWKQDVWPILQGPIVIKAYEENGSLVAQGVYEEKSWAFSDYELDLETITRHFFLPLWFSLKQPGIFRLTVETQFTTARNSTFLLEPERAVHFPISATGVIEILPPDEKLMGRVIQEIGQKAVETDFNPSLSRLYRIDDPRVVLFLQQKLRRWIYRPKSYERTQAFPRRQKQEGGIQTAFPIPLILIGFQQDPINQALAPLIGKLASFGTEEAMSALVEAATCDNDDARTAVAKSLPKCPHPKAFQLLGSMAKDQRWWVREAVAEGLGLDASPETEKTLVEMLDDPGPSIREAARKSLDARKANNPK
jgi:HEAT repeats